MFLWDDPIKKVDSSTNKRDLLLYRSIGSIKKAVFNKGFDAALPVVKAKSKFFYAKLEVSSSSFLAKSKNCAA